MNKSKSFFLMNEEKRATIWFLFLFYVVFFTYDLIYYYLLPMVPWGVDSPPNIGNYIIYLVLIALLPISIYFLKNDKPAPIKYYYFIIYSSIASIFDIIHFSGQDSSYASGNLVELALVLFSPIFVNKKYFKVIYFGSILKYIIIGVALQDIIVLFPILGISVIAVVAHMILHRFLNYVKAVENSYVQKIEGIVKSIIQVLELKDMYTKGHSERVADYALTLAKETGLYNEKQLQSFYYACLLHDIGKINIPDQILTKPGKLTDSEFTIIKNHPEIGAEALKNIEGIEDFLDVILYHHERWDGNGYPKNLKGENIPIAARITAIADAFDTMTSSRSYRPALTPEVAYQRVCEASGTQFDPELVELFKRVYPTWMNQKCTEFQ